MNEPLLFAPLASREFGERVAAALDTSLAPMEEREFEGGEHKTRPLVGVRGRSVFVLYAERDSAESLADRISELVQNSDRARALGQSLRARAINRFSWDDAARRLLGVSEAIRAPRPEMRAAALGQLHEGDHAHEPR